MPRLFLDISYKGSAYCGWQRQPNGLSIQESVENALSILFQDLIAVMRCGRTDAGVHAINYILHFDVAGKYVDNIVYKLNSLLPNDIVANNVYSVVPEAHARFDAISRSYCYRIHTDQTPFKKDVSLFYPWKEHIKLDLFAEIDVLIKSTRSFKTFCKSNSGNEHYKCSIEEIGWIETENGCFEFRVTSNRFLRGMIRLLVGMYLNIGRGKITLEELRKTVDSDSILEPNWSVPPDGLYLEKISYPESIFLDK